MTKQEYLDLIVRTSKAGLFPARGTSPGADCLYRTPEGRKCFAGLLIPDDKYKPSLEGALANYHEVMTIITVPGGMTDNDLCDVQAVHDFWSRKHTEWDHDRVVARLLALPCFAGMTPTAA